MQAKEIARGSPESRKPPPWRNHHAQIAGPFILDRSKAEKLPMRLAASKAREKVRKKVVASVSEKRSKGSRSKAMPQYQKTWSECRKREHVKEVKKKGGESEWTVYSATSTATNLDST